MRISLNSSVCKKTLDFCECLIRKRQVQGGRWLKNKSLLSVNDCFEDKPNAAIGVFLQALKNTYIFILLYFLVSCNPSLKLAEDFVDNRKRVSVMLISPPNSFLSYYKNNPSATHPDSLIQEDIENSNFLSNIDLERADSIFFQSIVNKIKALRIQVFTYEDFDAFLQSDGPKFIFNAVQTEILEYLDTYTDRAIVYNQLYQQDFETRNLARNTWFEFSTVSSKKETKEDEDFQVLYSNFVTGDYIDGSFFINHSYRNVVYEYDAFPIGLDDVYELNRFAGEQNALYIFNYIMNYFMEQNFTSSLLPLRPYWFNERTNRLERSPQARGFIILQ